MIEKNRTNGGRYLSESDRTAMQKEQREAKTAKKIQKRRRMLVSWAVAVIGNGLMLYMILHGLINDVIGRGCLIGLSFGSGRYGR